LTRNPPYDTVSLTIKESVMRIKPTQSWKLAGTNFGLDKDTVYEAIEATNQPDCEEREAIFAGTDENSMLLVKGEYEIVEE
jgi:hypothetical protein